MPRIPAVCDDCRTTFPSSYSVDGNLVSLSAFNVKSGPCPQCGGKGSLPDDVLASLEGLLTLRREQPAMVSELRMLTAAVGDAPDDEVHLEQLVSGSSAGRLLRHILRDPASSNPAQARKLLLAVLTFANSV